MKKILSIAFLAGILTPFAARAHDAGDLVFPMDYNGLARLEVRYENLQRGLRITSESPQQDSDLNADVFALALHSSIIPNARLDFEVGALDAGSGSYAPLLGAGVRFVAFDHGPWRIGTFGQLVFLSNVEQQQDLADVGDVDVEHNWIEASAGALASYRFRLADHFALVPYAGPMISLLRLDGEIKESERDGQDFKAKEDQFFGAAAGLALETLGMNGIRFEIQLFDDISASVAAAYAF